MKFKATVVSLLAAMLAVITVGMSMMVMEAKKQTEAARDTAFLTAIQTDISTWENKTLGYDYPKKFHSTIWDLYYKYEKEIQNIPST